MAGRVLRDSRGRYAGSTRGWGRGRGTHGGGFGPGIKGRTKQLRSPAETRRRIQQGASIGIAVGGTVATHVLARKAIGAKNPKKLIAGATVAVIIANAGGIAAKTLRKGRT
jgi:hypothetical protein